MTADDLTAEDERDCARLLTRLEAAVDDCLASVEDGPRFTSALEISALLRLASRKIREAVEFHEEDGGRYVALLSEMMQLVPPGPADTGRVN